MKFPLLTTPLILAAGMASACDLCVFELPSIRLVPKSGWHAGISEQFTDYSRLQDSGRGIANPAGQYMHSSITQFFAGYDFTDSFGVQLNIPYIARTFRRADEAAIESGTESGFGDISLIGSWTALHIERGDFRFTARVNAGIKFPTGDSSRLKEEGEHHTGHEEEHFTPTHEEHALDHDHAEAEEPHEEEAHETPSGVHGHDLALGTGSIDGIFGGDLHLQWKRAFFDLGVQYTLRGDGRHQYDYADDVSWHAGGGAVLLENEKWNVALGVRFSGEAKGEDDFRGQRLDDTSINTVFFGPRLAMTWDEKLSANVGIDFPIRRENSGIQSTPEYRVQAGIAWQF